MVKTNLAMLMNIETVESKHVITLGELGRRERNDIQRGKEFRCYVTDNHLVDVVLKKDRIDSLLQSA